MLRIFSYSLVVVAFFVGNAAQAAVIVSSTAYGMRASDANTLTFDDPAPTGFTLTGGEVRTGSDRLGVAPAIADGIHDASAYLAVNAWDPATITSKTGYRSVSLYWGSMDSWNTLSLLGKNGASLATFTGSDVRAYNQRIFSKAETNREVTFDVSASDAPIYGLRFESSKPAFEVDNVRFSSAVPEPATWAMLILGFGVIGGALRLNKDRARDIASALKPTIA